MSLTIDRCLVVRDIKVVEGPRGLFVAMPSRRVTDRCPGCGGINPVRARFCGDCGKRLLDQREETDVRGKPLLYADVAHPIHKAGRDLIERTILVAYRKELEHSEMQGYVPQHFDGLDYGEYEERETGGGVRRDPSIRRSPRPGGRSLASPPCPRRNPHGSV